MFGSQAASCTYFRWFIQEAVHEVIQKFIGIVYFVCELAQYPYHGSFRLGFIQCIKVLTKFWNDALVLPRVPSENIFGDDYCLLDDISHFCLDELEQ
jgi:hypothetical protein